MIDKYLSVLEKLAFKSLKKNEIAVAAIVVKDGKIISKAYNKRMNNRDVTAHAEILAIRKAEKRLGDWRLNGYDMYVTLKPCDMCLEVIKESRIDNCWYLVDKPDNQNIAARTNVCYLQTKLSEKVRKILQKSLKKLR